MLSPSRTWAIMAKEFIQLTRDRLTYAMILLLPIIQLLLFGYAINDDPRHLPTAVLVQDNGGFSRSILTAMNNSGYFDITLQARSQGELDRALERGEVQFAVIIPADFTRRVVRGDAARILVEADATDPSATSGAVAALASLPAQALTRELTGPLA
ncbi:ABC transporter permease, partial [uncultured Brevundimonas sp.]|uniref:ABC transporter permease n=1 Tax=uncultured Brevundimonas sp. TaxID=213418 RepID=UPI00262C3D80